MKGRPADPKRERRGTGNRPAAGRGKSVTAAAPAAPPTIAAAEPPATLGEAGRVAWRAALGEMANVRTLHEIDLVMLNAWAEAVQLHADASEALSRSTLTVIGAMGGEIPNPLIRIQKDAATTIRQLSSELGLSPLARIRLGLMEAAAAASALDLRDRLAAKIAKG